MPRKDFFSVLCYISDYLVPRCLGLLPFRYDSEAEQYTLSRKWLTVCNISGLLFIGITPFAFIEINKNRSFRTLRAEEGFGRIMVFSHFAILYGLSVCIYIRQMWFSKHQMCLMNRCMWFYRQCETLSFKKTDVNRFIYSFIFRGFFSYFGYALLNYYAMMNYFNDLSHVSLIYRIYHFVPNFLITTNAIHFHWRMISLTICGRCFNRALSTCIESINKVQSAPTADFERICATAIERFEYLMSYHAEWYEIGRMMEKETSLLMVFTVANSFYNITETVICF